MPTLGMEFVETSLWLLRSCGGPKMPTLGMEFVETSLWLLRSCGKYDCAIDVLKQLMDNPNRSIQGGWSYTKYENYTTDLLKELLSSKDE